jgi:hypothetical protein
MTQSSLSTISSVFGPMLPVLACVFALLLGVHLVACVLRHVRRTREHISETYWNAAAQEAKAEGVPYTFADDPDQIDAPCSTTTPTAP